MASSTSLPSMMTDALSCPIYFRPYDLDCRLPKVFPCQHTICLTCADNLCQQRFSKDFPCPTCRQPVTIPAQGAVGLHTNPGVSNIVEVMHQTQVCSIVNPDCERHPCKTISHVCMICKVGLCSECFTSSAMKDHSDHQVLEVQDAFNSLTQTCETLVEKGIAAKKVFQTKCDAIDRLSTSIVAAVRSRGLYVFAMIEELSALIDTTAGDPQNPAKQNRKIAQQNIQGSKLAEVCDNPRMLPYAIRGIKAGTVELESYSSFSSLSTIACTRLAAITLQLDLLRLKLSRTRGEIDVTQTLRYMWNLTDESQLCCMRIVILGGIDLLVNCFERFTSNVDVVRLILSIYGNLSEQETLHAELLTTKVVSMLTYAIRNFTMSQKQIPQVSCRILSFLLCNESGDWPENCLSKDKLSTLLISTCEQFRRNEPLTERYTSLRPLVELLSQSVSEAAKFWPVWTLNRCTEQQPQYRALLVHDGGIPVLKRQSSAHKYVREMSEVILKQIT